MHPWARHVCWLTLNSHGAQNYAHSIQPGMEPGQRSCARKGESFNRVGPTGGCFAGRPKGGLGRTAADGEMD